MTMRHDLTSRRNARARYVIAAMLALGLAAAGCGDDDGAAGDGGLPDAQIGQDGATPDAGPGPDAAPVDGTVEPPLADVHLNGRFDLTDPARPRSAWSGSTVRARWTGTGISVQLDSEGENYLEVVVDGEHSVIQTAWGEETFALASGLAPGEHEVEVFRRSEAHANAVSFLGFVVEGGALVPSAWPWSHRLEFIGDSITAGYGVLGLDQNCSFSYDTESAYLSWASVAARDLGAAAHLIAWSGKGVYQNYGGDTEELMPVLYERTIPTEADSQWGFTVAAEAVIIHLGTNDFSVAVDQGQFEAAYEDLILQVRGHHPDAAIYCVGGEFLNATATTYLGNVITALGDPDVHLLDLPGAEDTEGWGCDWHPSAATHDRVGRLVADRLRTDLGW
jgi:lysophospholipase L1-like esterase